MLEKVQSVGKIVPSLNSVCLPFLLSETMTFTKFLSIWVTSEKRPEKENNPSSPADGEWGLEGRKEPHLLGRPPHQGHHHQPLCISNIIFKHNQETDAAFFADKEPEVLTFNCI